MTKRVSDVKKRKSSHLVQTCAIASLSLLMGANPLFAVTHIPCPPPADVNCSHALGANMVGCEARINGIDWEGHGLVAEEKQPPALLERAEVSHHQNDVLVCYYNNFHVLTYTNYPGTCRVNNANNGFECD